MTDVQDKSEFEETELGSTEEVQPEGTLICALTGRAFKDTPDEQTIQSLIEQLHREYSVSLEDMERDFRVILEIEDPHSGQTRKQRRTVSLATFESESVHTQENVIRVAVVAKSATKPAAKKGVPELQEILGSLNDRPQIFGLWTNGSDLAFRMRTFHKRTGAPEFTELTDFPAPDESLEDLENAERRPLRIASGDSLLRTFKRCHDYLYGNQSMRGDRAFWQLLYLIFAKILDEQQTRRAFFVGATEGNTDVGRKRVAKLTAYSLSIRKRRSRLIHYQNAGILRQRFGNFDHLLLCDTEPMYQYARVDIEANHVENAFSFGMNAPPVN